MPLDRDRLHTKARNVRALLEKVEEAWSQMANAAMILGGLIQTAKSWAADLEEMLEEAETEEGGSER